jgi:hypothetical protein
MAKIEEKIIKNKMREKKYIYQFHGFFLCKHTFKMISKAAHYLFK